MNEICRKVLVWLDLEFFIVSWYTVISMEEVSSSNLVRHPVTGVLVETRLKTLQSKLPDKTTNSV